MRPSSASAATLALSIVALTCLALVPPVRAAAEDEPEPPSLLGPVSREQIEEAEPSWVAAQVGASPDVEAARALAGVEPGAEVTIYLGTWCSDSRREVPRFWRALDEAGGSVPFAIDYIAVDRAAKRPPELESEVGLRFVPTFIVRRGGEEVGRVVETSPDGIEKDLLALLSGTASGVISARDDLDAESEPHR
jgi:hypothetical protein